MMENPYDVGRWLAEQMKANRTDRVTDNEVFMWAGRAAQPIHSVKIDESACDDGALIIEFEDVGKLVIADRGRSCCEARYMTCDDDLNSFVGARIAHIDLEAGSDEQNGDYGYHEEAFLKVRTTNGDFTVVNHNVHNGYYGGFNVSLSWEDG